MCASAGSACLTQAVGQLGEVLQSTAQLGAVAVPHQVDMAGCPQRAGMHPLGICKCLHIAQRYGLAHVKLLLSAWAAAPLARHSQMQSQTAAACLKDAQQAL